jgi:hypothetical protein
MDLDTSRYTRFAPLPNEIDVRVIFSDFVNVFARCFTHCFTFQDDVSSASTSGGVGGFLRGLFVSSSPSSASLAATQRPDPDRAPQSAVDFANGLFCFN